MDDLRTTTGDDVRTFLDDLRKRINDGNHSLRATAAKSGYAVSTLSATLSGRKLPSPELIKALLSTLDAPIEEVNLWLQRRDRLLAGIGHADRRSRIGMPEPGYPTPMSAPAFRTPKPHRLSAVAALAATAGIAGTLLTDKALDVFVPHADGETAPRDLVGVSDLPAPAVLDYAEGYVDHERPAVISDQPRKNEVRDTEIPPHSRVVLICRINDGDVLEEQNGRRNSVWYLLPTGDWVPDQHVKLAKASSPVPQCPEAVTLVSAEPPRPMVQFDDEPGRASAQRTMRWNALEAPQHPSDIRQFVSSVGQTVSSIVDDALSGSIVGASVPRHRRA